MDLLKVHNRASKRVEIACKSPVNPSENKPFFVRSLHLWRVSWTSGGCWTLDFSKCPTEPPGGGAWTLGLSESPTDPPGGGGWTLDFKKERIHILGGGCYKVTLVLASLTHVWPHSPESSPGGPPRSALRVRGRGAARARRRRAAGRAGYRLPSTVIFLR